MIDLGLRFGTGIMAIGRRACVVIVKAEREAGAHDVGIQVAAIAQAALRIPQATT